MPANLPDPSPLTLASRFRWALAVIATVLACTHAAQAQGEPNEFNPTIEMRLASVYVDDARDMLKAPQLTDELFDAAIVLLHRAVELVPDDVDTWLLLSKVATMAGEREIQIRATENLIRLDRSNDVARLVRLTQLAEKRQTVEERLAFYESLVNQARNGTLEPTTGSRIALECALLHRRAGNTDEFAEMLATAVGLDSANRRAAALAAGYFRANINDPLAEAELFSGLLIADPTDLRVADELAAILLSNGAYEGAERILAMVVEARRASGVNPPDDLLADWALAAWGRGDPEMAMRIIRVRQQERNDYARRLLKRADPTATAADLDGAGGSLSPSLEAVRLALHERLRPELVRGSLDSLMGIYRENINMLEFERDNEETATPPNEVFVTRYLEAAWLTIWLGSQVPQSQADFAFFLDQADTLIPLTDEAKLRFDGWTAIFQERYADAAALLEPLAENDVYAMLGLAVAQLELGQKRSGARHLLDVMREVPGTIMGVWAGERLSDILGQRLPLSDTAEAMETLMASVPRALDRFPSDPTMAVGLRIEPRQSVFGPYDPILIDVRLTNNAPIPLALDADGPIRPQVVIEPNYRISGITNDPETDPLPIIIDMDRRLRLEPGQSITVTYDLRESDIGTFFRRYRLRGGFIRMRAAVNFGARVHRETGRPIFQPGILGTEVNVPAFRVEGVSRIPGDGTERREVNDPDARATQMRQWLDEQRAELTLNPTDENVTRLVTVIGHLADPTDPTVELFQRDPARSDPNARLRLAAQRSQQAIDAAPALAQVWDQLSPEAQAWVLAESNWIPFDSTPVIQEHAAASLSADVIIIMLLQTVAEADDPWLNEMMNHEDDRIRSVARAVKALRLLGMAPELVTGGGVAPGE